MRVLKYVVVPCSQLHELQSTNFENGLSWPDITTPNCKIATALSRIFTHTYRLHKAHRTSLFSHSYRAKFVLGNECTRWHAGSREVASKIKEISPRLMASTGGPNTIFTTALTPQIAEAVQMSACIENSGQCTALRHVVAPTCTKSWVEQHVFAGVPLISEPLQSVRDAKFASLYEGGVHSTAARGDYDKHPSLPAYVRNSFMLTALCFLSTRWYLWIYTHVCNFEYVKTYTSITIHISAHPGMTSCNDRTL